MSAAPTSRHVLQPTLKAASTSQPSQLVATATSSAEDVRERSRSVKPRQDVSPEDATAEKPTLTLIRRVLARDSDHGKEASATPQPVEEFLPPLTSSNELDVQLYAIIAIIIKDFVQSWYTNITSDHAFVDEVVQIIAHCCRALEQRARHVDFVELLLDEIPRVLERHIHAFRTATSPVRTSPFPTDTIQIYNALNPHPALSPCPSATSEQDLMQQKENETAYRQVLVQGLLAVLLPTEDLQNACLLTLVGDIISDLILGEAIAGKVCEGWFLHGAISKFIATTRSHVEQETSGQDLRDDTRGRLERFGLLSSKSPNNANHSSKSSQSMSSVWFWRILQYMYLVYLCMRYLILGISQARNIPPRSHRKPSSPTGPLLGGGADALLSKSIDATLSVRPVVAYRALPVVALTLNLSTRMPWLHSFFIYMQHVAVFGLGRLASANSIFDRFLHETLQTQILRPSLLPQLLRVARANLFPDNTIGRSAPSSLSTVETWQIRRKAAEDILSLVPDLIARRFFATTDHDEMLVRVEEEILDLFQDAYMNKHVVYQILDLVIVRLVPEMAEKAPSKLLAERGVGDEEEGDEEDIEIYTGS